MQSTLREAQKTRAGTTRTVLVYAHSRARHTMFMIMSHNAGACCCLPFLCSTSLYGGRPWVDGAIDWKPFCSAMLAQACTPVFGEMVQVQNRFSMSWGDLL